ncbi:unnamed protein product, partial [Leptidea sinapis]
MPNRGSECDAFSILLALCVFTIPLTILIPEFSVWNVIPKVQIMRWHIFQQSITWSELNLMLRQAAAVGVCIKLLDASTEHYENLILLRNEFRRRDKGVLQHPPLVELSPSEM